LKLVRFIGQTIICIVGVLNDISDGLLALSDVLIIYSMVF